MRHARLFNETLRRRGNFILTSLGLREKGFYTPYNYLDTVDWAQQPYPAITRVFGENLAAFYDFLDTISSNEAALTKIASTPGQPAWNTRFISALDGAAIYSGIAKFRPSKIIEIGSGTSTHFMMRAIQDHALTTEVTCIDPAPRADITALDVVFHRRVLSPDDVGMFERLGAGDVLFVDSSHILQQGFDVDIILNRILPVLRPGVIVHFHDIFLPYGYQTPWQIHRFNEQTALVSWLITGKLRPLFASYFMWRDHSDAVRNCCPQLFLGGAGNGGTVWLEIT